MSEPLAWLGALVGSVVVVVTAVDIVGTLVVPRRFNSKSSSAVGRLVAMVFFTVLRPVHRYERRDSLLTWAGPLMLLLRLLAWVALLTSGFALLLLPTVNGHLGRALSEAGSSVFTSGTDRRTARAARQSITWPPTAGCSS